MNGQVVVMVFLDLNQDVQTVGRMDGMRAGDFKIWKTILRIPVPGLRASSGSHMDVKFIGDKRDVKRTFCMKENAAIETRFCPFIKGKVSSLYVYTD